MAQKCLVGASGRRVLSRTFSLVLLLFVLVALRPTPVFASMEYADLAGADAYETSIRLSQAAFGPGVEAVVVANGDDALTAGPASVLAAAYEGPLLLTSNDSLAPGIIDELWRLGPAWIFFVGTSPVPVAEAAAAFPEVASAGRVVMLCGADVSDTALLVAQTVVQETRSVDGVVLMSQEYGASATSVTVAASAVAAGKCWPLIFVPDSGELPEGTVATLENLAPSVVLKVQSSVDFEGSEETTALEGEDPYEVGYYLGEYAATTGFSYEHVAMVSGGAESDRIGLAVGAYLADTGGIVVISGSDGIPPSTLSLLSEQAGTTARVDFCGLPKGGQDLAKLVIDETGLPDGFGEAILTQRSKGAAVWWVEQRLTDLSYRPGPVDGVFDRRTRMAVIAFQKWEGLSRDGVVGQEVWWKLLTASRPVPQYAEEGRENAPDGRWIEVDKAKQVLMYCVDGVVERTLAVSTGSSSVGVATPSGMHFVRRENTYERFRYKPLYLTRNTLLAIHGYTSVPTYPASHGCVRMTWDDMDEFHGLIPVGTPVLVY